MAADGLGYRRRVPYGLQIFESTEKIGRDRRPFRPLFLNCVGFMPGHSPAKLPRKSARPAILATVAIVE